MNRKERRAALARGKAADATAITIVEQVAEATSAYQQGRLVEAELICLKVQARAPVHSGALNVLGLVYQATGRHRLAVKTFAAAIATDDLDAACHYNVACSYQALEERELAATHFKKAIMLGLSGRDVEQFVMKNAVVVDSIARMTENEHGFRR